MIEHDSLCSNALDSWNYGQLSWPFKRGFSFSFATMMKGNHSAHRFRINNVFFFRCRVWCQRWLKWYFIERYCELWFGKMSQSWKKRPYATSSWEITGRLIDGYTWEQWVSETIRQKRTGFSYIFLYVARYDSSLHSFLYCVKLLRNCTKLKRIVTSTCYFFNSSLLIIQPNFNDHGNSSHWNTKFVLYLFLALLKFDLNEDKLELAYLISNLTTKRDLRFDLRDVFRNLERFHVG